MTNRSVLYEFNFDLSTAEWSVSVPLDQALIGPVQYGWDRFQKDPNSMTFGGGLLAGSPLPGTRRMIFCGYSPQWEDFYVSALGGAMYVFHRMGVNYVWLRGQCPVDSILILRLKNGEYSARLEPVNPNQIWQGYADQTGRIWEGFYALQQYAFEKYRGEYDEDSFRILATGPGARHSNAGAIGSNQIRKGQISVIDDWAGRGGLGSRLLQYHHIAAIIFGGDWQDPALKEAKELDEFFLKRFDKRAMAADIALSQKYRYVPEFETGGTFGVNMHTANDNLFSFNYQSIYASDAERLKQHDEFILDHYLKQFNEEIIKPKNFDHCGEPCAVVCKKHNGEFKKDYEPYEALGPQCGIFDQRAAERVNKFVDTMGLDSIQTGGLVAWIMELIAEGLIPPADFGLPIEGPHFFDRAEKTDRGFVSRADQFNIEQDSAHNADYAIAIIKMMLFSEAGEPFRLGMRAAAKWLDQKYGIKSIDRAVYTAHGENGCMVPNQYWTPGMFAPMPLMGKYFSYYENKFLPPRQLGRKNAERFVYELYSENSGACRFHRKWVEDIIDEIILSHFTLNFDYWRDQFTLAKAIHDHQSSRGVMWESERVVDIIRGFLEKWGRDGLREPELLAWLEKFRADKWQAAREFWQEMYDGMSEAFVAGFPEPTPTQWPNSAPK
ncbi:MAG TPA: aldehyde ferredoxin oxidoreductase C-terminal domain-containing protein [Anaerolineae bacterium]|nr:aldehyde ferredoxin oxidoreductase C-terminal domain-containing protein [Anaerolineae bacterium]